MKVEIDDKVYDLAHRLCQVTLQSPDTDWFCEYLIKVGLAQVTEIYGLHDDLPTVVKADDRPRIGSSRRFKKEEVPRETL